MLKKLKRIGRGLVVSGYNACFNRAYGYVIMLHRIGPKERKHLPCISELIVTPERLQKFVDEHRGSYDFVSLDVFLDRFNNADRRTRPCIAFTFDDGYRDNYTFGLPFFEYNQIPFSVFVTVDFINRHPSFNFPFILQHIICENDCLCFGDEVIDCSSKEKKNDAFVKLKNRVLSFPYNSFESVFFDYFRNYYSESVFNQMDDLTLTWDEVKKLSASPLCTIGSHAMTHCRLSQVPIDLLKWELGESKRQIEEIIQSEVKYITYPFGWYSDVNDTVLAEASKFYSAGFQSFGGGVRRKDNMQMKINRIMLTEDK